MAEYSCVVTLSFGGNCFEATTIEEYKEKVMESFKEEFGLDLIDEEIGEITRIT